MCGIAGIVSFDGIADIDVDSVRQMVDYLSHRGPDGRGAWHDGMCALGHSRLSIIDLECGAQPMVRDDLGLAIVFNGEIYNYRELRRELESVGFVFRTQSDTEVLLVGYRHWGRDLFQKLNGMFALGIRDKINDEFVLARDRFGEKPLYIFQDNDGRIVFSSEVKALLAAAGVPRALNEDVLTEYLAYRAVLGPATLFRDISEFPAATVRTYTRNGVSSRRYWILEQRSRAGDYGDTSAVTESLLFSATQRRLVADVKVGSLLSGGLDSSLVAAMASKSAQSQLDTFCVGFEDQSLDERPYASAVAQHIGSRHHEIVVRDVDVRDELASLTWAHDTPITHPNAVPMHIVLRFAKRSEGVKVVLSGEGADELFGGYAWYDSAARRPQWLSSEALHAISRFVPPFGRLASARRVFHRDYLLEANSVTSWARLNQLSVDTTGLRNVRLRAFPCGRSDRDALYLFDQLSYLPALLQRQDRMSMAAGVEARVVFLDHELAEYINWLPDHVKRANGIRKALLRTIAARWIPTEILHRRKIGFNLPLQRWLNKGGALYDLRDLVASNSSVSIHYLSKRARFQLLDNESLTEESADLLWTCISLDLWKNIFLAGAGPQKFLLSGSILNKA